jgi:anaerobic ribonucleoside-triphosphate reductase activating protein
MMRELSSTALGVARLHFPITALGYGHRIGLWTQGCSIGCKGCMSLDTWAPAKRHVPIEVLLDRVSPWLEMADGLTISGGEPLEQPEALAAFLELVRPRVSGDILAFTGFDYDEIPKLALPTLAFFDAIVCGPFDDTQTSGRPLIGSDNQALRILTPLGKTRYWDTENGDTLIRSIDLIEDASGVWFAGIPKQGDLQRLGAILAARSITLKTSSGRLGGDE